VKVNNVADFPFKKYSSLSKNDKIIFFRAITKASNLLDSDTKVISDHDLLMTICTIHDLIIFQELDIVTQLSEKLSYQQIIDVINESKKTPQLFFLIVSVIGFLSNQENNNNHIFFKNIFFRMPIHFNLEEIPPELRTKLFISNYFNLVSIN
jgi:hypothetical protein